MSALNIRMTGELITGKDTEQSGCVLTGLVQRNLSGGNEENHENIQLE
jgi:hypothetical protein